MFQDPDRVIETDDYEEVVNLNEEKLSALIRRAVDGYDKLDGNKFQFTSSQFLLIRRNINRNSTTCLTCLAGSLASFIQSNASKLTFVNYGGGLFFYDLYSKMRGKFSITEELKAIGMTKTIIRDIIALECVRNGQLSKAISYHEMLPKNVPPFNAYNAQQGYTSHVDYDNPELKEEDDCIEWYSKKMWKEDARDKILHRADLLEAAGY